MRAPRATTAAGQSIRHRKAVRCNRELSGAACHSLDLLGMPPVCVGVIPGRRGVIFPQVIGAHAYTSVGSRTGVTGFNLWSMFVAIIGAIVVLSIKHAIMGRGQIHT